jgi:phosphoribosylformylglycinamidine synthase
MYVKEPGDLIYVVGDTFDELGGSHYYDLTGFIGNTVPRVNTGKARSVFMALSRAAELGLVRAMHDCSEGGIGVSAAEMAFAGGRGMDLFLAEVPYNGKAKRNDFILFSESNSRFVVEVAVAKQKDFEKTLKGIPFGLIGCVSNNENFRVFGLDGRPCLKTELVKLKESWQRPLRW